MPKQRKVSVCLTACGEYGNWTHGVFNTTKQALELSSWKYEFVSRSEDANDILFYHYASTPSTATSAKDRFLFCHDTQRLGPRQACLEEGYSCVANSELMRDMFYKKHGHVFDVSVVHNHPDWALGKKSSNKRSGAIWLGRVNKYTKATYLKVAQCLLEKNIPLTVVSNRIPPITKNNVLFLEKVRYCDLYDLLSQYEFGFGIGRSILDLSACGVKSMVAGTVLGTALVNEQIASLAKTNWTGVGQTWEGTVSDLMDYAQLSRDALFETMSPKNLIREIENMMRSKLERN